MNRPLLSSQNSLKTCRICFDNDNPIDFISPCLCKGGSAYVHRECLDEWRSLNNSGRAFKYCDVCQFEYIIEPVVDDPSADRKRLLKFRLLVTRDIALIILFLQAAIIGMTFLLKFADKESHKIRNLYPSSVNSFGVYYLSSLILFFALLGIFGLVASCFKLANNDADNRSSCACYGCFCSVPDCNDSSGNNNCGGDGAGILLVVVVLFAILGVFVGIILSGIIIRKIAKRHTNKLWLKQETKKYIVKDLEGRASEFTKRSTEHPMTNLFTHAATNTGTIPSAPIHSLSMDAQNTQEASKSL